jgi:hypothetical protein
MYIFVIEFLFLDFESMVAEILSEGDDAAVPVQAPVEPIPSPPKKARRRSIKSPEKSEETVSPPES